MNPNYLIDLPPLYTAEAYAALMRYVESLQDEGLKAAYKEAVHDLLPDGPPVQISAHKYDRVLKYNPYHQPKGSSIGGQFAPKGGGSWRGTGGSEQSERRMPEGVKIVDLAHFLDMMQPKKLAPYPSRNGPTPTSPIIEDGVKRLKALGVEVGGNHPTLVKDNEEESIYRGETMGTPLYLTKEQFEPVVKGVADEMEYLHSKGVNVDGLHLRIDDSGVHVENCDGVTYNNVETPDAEKHMFLDPTGGLSAAERARAISDHQITGRWFSASSKGWAKFYNDPDKGTYQHIRHTFRHELGHVLSTGKFLDEVMNEVGEEKAINKFTPRAVHKHISIYGATNLPEGLAETFARVMDPEYGVQGGEKKVPKFFEDMVQRLIHIHDKDQKEPKQMELLSQPKKAAESRYPASEKDYQQPVPEKWPPLVKTNLSEFPFKKPDSLLKKAMTKRRRKPK